MKNMPRIIPVLALVLGIAMTSSAADWWNAAWKYRLPVSVNFGMAETENPLITARIDRAALQKVVGDVDPGSFRLVDAKGVETPCVVRVDAGGDSFVVWRVPGKTVILDVRKYAVYLDSKTNGPKAAKAYETLADVPPVVPGMNLVANGSFTGVDENGFPKDWNFTKGNGTKELWTDAQKEIVQVVKMDGRSCVKLGKGTVMQVIKGLKEGQSCKFSYLGKVDPGATVIATVVFRRAGLDWFRNGIGNYKMQVPVSKPGDWAVGEASTFVYVDKDKVSHYNNKNLLPETETAFLEVTNYNPPEGAIVRVTDFRFELAGEAGEMKVSVGEIEARR